MSRLPTSEDGFTLPVTDGASLSRGGHVLIADSNEASRDRRLSQLRAAGFRVSMARTGFEAIVKASCQVPDLILIDDALGGLEAADTGRLITTCPTTAHIPVIQLSPGRRVPQRLFSWMRRLVD